MKQLKIFTKALASFVVVAIAAVTLSGCFGGGNDDSNDNVSSEPQPTSPQNSTQERISSFFINIPAFPLRATDKSRAYYMVKNLYDKYISLVIEDTDEAARYIEDIPTLSRMEEEIIRRSCTLRDGVKGKNTTPETEQNDIIEILEDYSVNSTDSEYYQFSFLVWASYSFEYEHTIIVDEEGNIEDYDYSDPNFRDLCHK